MPESYKRTSCSSSFAASKSKLGCMHIENATKRWASVSKRSSHLPPPNVDMEIHLRLMTLVNQNRSMKISDRSLCSLFDMRERRVNVVVVSGCGFRRKSNNLVSPDFKLRKMVSFDTYSMLVVCKVLNLRRSPMIPCKG